MGNGYRMGRGAARRGVRRDISGQVLFRDRYFYKRDRYFYYSGTGTFIKGTGTVVKGSGIILEGTGNILKWAYLII